MTAALVRHNGQLVPMPTPANSLTESQVDLVKRTICKGATDEELQLFVTVCNKTGLDPFSRQIYAVKRWDGKLGREVMQIQIGIDGYRLNSARTKQYEGVTEPLWCGSDGQWTDIWLSNEPPVAAKVGVYRKGFREAVYGIAKYSEFVQTDNKGNVVAMWRKMPSNQLAIAAERQAHRKAFPNETAAMEVNAVEAGAVVEGIEAEIEATYTEVPALPVQPSNSDRINKLFRDMGITDKNRKKEIGSKVLMGRKANDLTQEELIEALAEIQAAIMEGHDFEQEQDEYREWHGGDVVPREQAATFRGVSIE